MLGTCTISAAASGFDESSSPTANIESDSVAPANGPAREMSTFVFLSGRIDLNCKIQHKHIIYNFKVINSECINFASQQ